MIRNLAGVLLLGSGALMAEHEAIPRIAEAATVLNEIMKAPDKGIPQELLEDAYCVAIVPDVKKGAFIVGAQYGKGVMTCRTSSSSGWSGPSTVRIEGGSIGPQIGGGEMDVVLIVRNKTGAEKLMGNEFTFGAGAEVMAGPVGRAASAKTDAVMNAQILSYSRSRGVFAGVSLNGASLRSDDKDNEVIYGKAITHRAILTGGAPAPAAAKPLYAALNRHSVGKRTEIEAATPRTTTDAERSRTEERPKKK